MKKSTEGLRKRLACWLLAASAILSAGCYVTEINADGSGTLSREVVSPPGTDPQKFCPGAPKGYSTTVEGTLCRATARFTNLSELRDLLEAAQASQDAMTDKLRQMCAAQIPGDTYRNLVIHPTFSAQTFKHILVPVWLLSYLYGTRLLQVVVNGYSGRMAGQYPKSPWKIAFLVLLAIIAFFIFVMLNQNN